MAQRELQTSEPNLSTSLAEGIDLSPRLLPKFNPAQQILNICLSIHPLISTGSSYASETEATQYTGVDQTFQAIGAGTCGTVFEIPGTLDVVKRAKVGFESPLWNDCVSQKYVCEAFDKHHNMIEDLRVPRVVNFIAADDETFWNKHGRRFPEAYQAPSALYFTQRILPLPTVVRHALIDEYFPDALKLKAKIDIGNKNCLIRLYLGKRRDLTRQKPVRATLLNYNLHLDQMEDLKLNTSFFAAIMGRGLAIMHWEAKIDGEDVEFVLGCSPPIAMEPMSLSAKELESLGKPTSLTPPAFDRKVIGMWLLDFNRCNRIPVRGNTVEESMILRRRAVGLAISAFYKNDPYYPRPLSGDILQESLWNTFKEAYLRTSQAVLREESDTEIKELPQGFIRGLITEARARQIKKAEAQQRLAENRSWESYQNLERFYGNA